jgi:hypothetical protein
MIFDRYKTLVEERADNILILDALKNSNQDPEIVSIEISDLIYEINSLDKKINQEIAAISLKLIGSALILFTITLTLIKLL